MTKKSRNRKIAKAIPATEVEIEFRVTIREVHTRTTTICDRRVDTHIFEFGHDFEGARDWLESDESWFDIDSLCSNACERIAAKPGATR